MEDALVHLIAGPWQFITCLNPCFNGRCTSTKTKRPTRTVTTGLNPCFNGRCTSTAKLQ